MQLVTLSYDALVTKLANTNATIRYIEQVPTHQRSEGQRATLKELRADRLALRRAAQKHPDRPIQMDFFDYPARARKGDTIQPG